MADTSCGGLLAGHTSMGLHGPRGLSTLVNAFRTFINVKDMGLKVHEFPAQPSGEGAPPSPAIQNELVTITPVVLIPEGAPADSSAPEGKAEPEAKRQRLERDAGGGVTQVPSVAVRSPAACYVCELPSIPGKFLPQKVGGQRRAHAARPSRRASCA